MLKAPLCVNGALSVMVLKDLLRLSLFLSLALQSIDSFNFTLYLHAVKPGRRN